MFENVQRIKPNACRTRSREFYYLGKGWKLKKPKVEEPTKEHIKVLAEYYYGLGYKCNYYLVDSDMETKLKEQIGEFDKNKPGIDKLKDVEGWAAENAKEKRLSFAREIPLTLPELENFVKRMANGEVEIVQDNSSESEGLTSDEEYDPRKDLEEWRAKLKQDVMEQAKNAGREEIHEEDLKTPKNTLEDLLTNEREAEVKEREKTLEEMMSHKHGNAEDNMFKKRKGQKRLNDYLRGLKDSNIWNKE